ncbi:anthrone oxygenase family protein [Devosia sp. XK-2]|uniref:anthrone oxygenase family protein n=1 Tax=Devosia sp. XK-2 TaxID=3126689 RepID=UPI0030CB0C0A
MHVLILPISLLALLLSGGIFGFFYAWVCSTMWGLDAADPRVAIEAMQAMNASVRNAVFAPAFFGTPIVALAAAALAWLDSRHRAAVAFGAAGILYLFGAFAVTMVVNVPMNAALAQVVIPVDIETAGQVWTAYSAPWQFWNALRTVVSGLSLMLVGWGLVMLKRR